MWSVGAVALASAVFLGLGWLKLGSADKSLHFGRRRWLVLISLSLIATFASLVEKFSDYSGTGISTKYGWPHAFYQRWVGFDSVGNFAGFWPGPFGIYFLVDVLFYLSLAIFLLSAVYDAKLTAKLRLGKKADIKK